MIDDKGPWIVRRDDDRKWRICSENFKHDVELIVTGDFKDDTEVVEYAAMIARKLSGAPLDGSLAPSPEGMAFTADVVRLVKIVDKQWCLECGCWGAHQIDCSVMALIKRVRDACPPQHCSEEKK